MSDPYRTASDKPNEPTVNEIVYDISDATLNMTYVIAGQTCTATRKIEGQHDPAYDVVFRADYASGTPKMATPTETAKEIVMACLQPNAWIEVQPCTYVRSECIFKITIESGEKKTQVVRWTRA